MEIPLTPKKKTSLAGNLFTLFAFAWLAGFGLTLGYEFAVWLITPAVF